MKWWQILNMMFLGASLVCFVRALISLNASRKKLTEVKKSLEQLHKDLDCTTEELRDMEKGMKEMGFKDKK